MKKHGFFLSHLAKLLIDVFIFFSAVWLAYLLRFNFSIPASELKPLPFIFLIMVPARLLIFVFTGEYRGIIRYNTVFGLLRLYLYTLAGSMVFVIVNLVSYYLVNKTLFIPLTIVIIEFLITSFLLMLSRSMIRVSHTSSANKQFLNRLKESEE